MKLMILFCMMLLGRLGTATHLVIEGDSGEQRMYFHQSEYRLIGTLKDMAADCTDEKKQKMFVTETDTTKSRADQKVVEEVDVCVLNWNTLTTENEHRYDEETPIAKMFYFLKHIAPNYNDCSSLKYELSSDEDAANAQLQEAQHQDYNVEGNEECGKIGLKKPLPEGGFAAMTVRIMKTREEALKDIKKNVNYFQSKFNKLEGDKKKWTDKEAVLKTKAEEEEAKKADVSLEEWRALKKEVNTKSAFQLYKEEQEAALTKLLDKETITVAEIHDIQMAKEVGLDPKSWRIFRNENNGIKGENEMEANVYYGRNEKVKDVILEFFRFQVRDIEKGKEHVIKERERRVHELIETAKDLLRVKELKKKKECDQAREKWENDNEGKIIDIDNNLPKNCVYTEKTEEQLEREAPEETLANVSGWYGHANLPVNDCQLNEAKIDGQDEIVFKNSINSPRSLVRMLNVANHYNFQMLLDFSGAKLASVIHDNDLYRLRAMLGFDFLGDYTWESYIDVNGNRVSGIKEIEVKNPWFDKDSKNEKYHHSKVGDRVLLQGIGDFEGKCHNVIIHGGEEHSSWKLEKKDYLKNDQKLTQFQGWATEDGKDIPAEKLKFSKPDVGYSENNGKVYSNPDIIGGGINNPMAYGNQDGFEGQQEAIIGDLKQNPQDEKMAELKRQEEEQQLAETQNELAKMQEENELKKQALDKKNSDQAKDFKEFHQQSNANNDWEEDQDENMEDKKRRE